MAKKEKSNLPKTESNDTENAKQTFDTEIDFWQEVMTEYGEIESPSHLKLILKKLETEAAREKAKIGKKRRLVAQRNKAAKKKEIQRQKAEKRAFSALPASRKAEVRQKKADEKYAAKVNAKQAKADAKEALEKAKADQKAKKVVDAEFKMQERLFVLSLTPTEKAEYNFLKNAKTKIGKAKAKLEAAKAEQADVVKSRILPVKEFLITLAICIAVTAVLTFCLTNILIDTGYYNEKINALKSGLEEFDVKLDGEIVSGAGDLEAGLSVYRQVLGNMPVMEEQLDKLNNTYKWVLKKETPESLGMDSIADKAGVLQVSIDQLQSIVDTNDTFADRVNEAYQSDVAVDQLKTQLNDLSLEFDQLIYNFDTLELPTGLPEHKSAYKEKLVSTQTYIQLVISYVDELSTIRDEMGNVEAVIEDAKDMNVHSSHSLGDNVDDYMDELEKVTDIQKKLTLLNNTVDYAQVIGKKDFSYLASGIVSESALTFYVDMIELDDILKESSKVEKRCLDLPYPEVAEETHEEILQHISLGYTDEALETNEALVAQLAAITVPTELAASVRTYSRGLEKRTEFLKLQQEYVNLSIQKNEVFADYNAAKSAYETAKFNADVERKENGRHTDLYVSLYDEMKAAEDLMDEAESKAEDDADTIQEQMKVVRNKAIKQKEDYEDDLDF